LLFLLLAAGCRGATRQSDPDPASRVATMDTATARRICQSPDSVIAGTKECVLLDQGRPGGPQRSQPARRAP
jgi:hypothetical protein